MRPPTCRKDQTDVILECARRTSHHGGGDRAGGRPRERARAVHARAAAARRRPATIAGQYIVVLKNGKGAAAADRVERRARGRGGRVQRQYRRALNGFTAQLSSDALADVRTDPDVAYVEPDAVVSIGATQTGATWGLDRIDQRDLPLNQTYNYTATGAGVKAYIIDTGIRTSHAQFGGRADVGLRRDRRRHRR